MKWQNWINALLGVWFIISPWAVGFSSNSGALWTAIIIGLIQVIVAVWAVSQQDVSGWNVWQTWVSLLTGIWFIIMPFVFGLSSNQGELWTGIIFGVVTAVLSLWVMGGQGDSQSGSSRS